VCFTPFDYRGVRLLPSRLQQQVARTREIYSAIPNDDILKGFRRQAGLPAPGKDMGGWAARSSAGIFGQILSGMARLSRATSDDSLRGHCRADRRATGSRLPPCQHTEQRRNGVRSDWGSALSNDLQQRL